MNKHPGSAPSSIRPSIKPDSEFFEWEKQVKNDASVGPSIIIPWVSRAVIIYGIVPIFAKDSHTM